MAVPAAAVPGALDGSAALVAGNGWDAVGLGAGASLEFVTHLDGPVQLEIRIAPAAADGSALNPRFRVTPIGPDGSPAGPAAEIGVRTATTGPWQIVAADLAATWGRLRFEAVDPLTLQSIRGFVPAGGSFDPGSSPLPGWRVTARTPEAVTLEPIR
jgi:hypothetical protein